MESAIDVLSVILLVGTIQGLFLTFALLRVRKGNRLANRFLAFFLLTFSITLIDEFLYQSHYYLNLPHLLGTIWPTNMLYGPLLYFYVKAFTSRQGFRFGTEKLLHFIPLILSALYNLPLYLRSAEEKVALFTQRFATEGASDVYIKPGMVAYAETIQILIYLLICLWLLRQHREAVKNHFSYLEKVDLAWLRRLIFIIVGIWGIYAFAALLSPYLGVFDTAMYFVHLSIVVVIYSMGYLGIRQPSIFARLAYDESRTKLREREEITLAAQTPAEPLPRPETVKRKYQRSSLTLEQADQLLAALQEMMARDKPFLESELTLPVLAHRLGCSPNHLSQVINDKLHENFFDLVNRYRVEEAKRLLTQDKQSPKILAVALDTGFNSKSAFYNAFKKYVQMTPAQYRSIAA